MGKYQFLGKTYHTIHLFSFINTPLPLKWISFLYCTQYWLILFESLWRIAYENRDSNNGQNHENCLEVKAVECFELLGMKYYDMDAITQRAKKCLWSSLFLVKLHTTVLQLQLFWKPTQFSEHVIVFIFLNFDSLFTLIVYLIRFNTNRGWYYY